MALLEEITSLWQGWQIKRSDISFLPDPDADGENKQLGRGQTAEVFAGNLTSRTQEIPVAIKSFYIDCDIVIADILREAFLHLTVQHSAIVNMYGMYYPNKLKKRALIALERMAFSLEDALKENKPIDRKMILRDVADAVCYLHSNGIVHRDLKPGNILLSEDAKRAKLSDFGCSRRRIEYTLSTKSTAHGTIIYMPPEVSPWKPCTTSRTWDSWSFGIIICEVMCYNARQEFINNLRNDSYEAAISWALQIVDEEMQGLALSCLKNDPNDRAPMNDVYLQLAGASRTDYISAGILEDDGATSKVMSAWMTKEQVIEASTSDKTKLFPGGGRRQYENLNLHPNELNDRDAASKSEMDEGQESWMQKAGVHSGRMEGSKDAEKNSSSQQSSTKTLDEIEKLTKLEDISKTKEIVPDATANVVGHAGYVSSVLSKMFNVTQTHH